MRKLFFISFLILLIATTSCAQFGIRGGLSMATFTGDNKSMSLSRSSFLMQSIDPTISGFILPSIDPIAWTGIAGGISYKIGLILGLAIEPGIYYVQNGAVYKIENFQVAQGILFNGNVTYKTDYLQIPLIAKFTFPIPSLSPYIEGGMAYSVLLSAKLIEKTASTHSDGSYFASNSIERDLMNNWNKSDVSLVLGVGAEFLLFDVNARLILGQSKIDRGGNVKIYNHTFMVTAGVRL